MKFNSKTKIITAAAFFLSSGLIIAGQVSKEWSTNNTDRPRPDTITPGKTNTAPPSDAIVLFDGKNINEWVHANGEAAKWKLVEDGGMEVQRGTGGIQTKQKFGSCQLHIEWASPAVVNGNVKGQGRGNSGVFLQNRYEVQILDSYKNETYADGQAASIYGQYPPLVNACKPSGEWQTYDIIFTAPVFGKGNEPIKRGRITVIHNGVLVQNNVEIAGYGGWKEVKDYTKHPDRLPISLQDHGNPVRYRNIWIRPLKD